MWSKDLDACPLNSLATRAIKALIANNQVTSEDYDCNNNYVADDDDETGAEAINCAAKQLPINVRQQLINYVVRERKTITIPLLCQLIHNGIWSLDLWQISDILRISPYQIQTVLKKVRSISDSVRTLRIGGSTWIFDQSMITTNGLLVELFGNQEQFTGDMIDDEMNGNVSPTTKTRKWNVLRQLTVQQLSSTADLLAICENCPKLQSLEICQPCLTNDDLSFELMEKLSTNQQYAPIRHSLQHLCLPSSFNGKAIAKLLSLFPRVKTLKCARFEQLMELLMELEFDNHFDDRRIINGQMVRATLSALESLTITHPMSRDSIGYLVRFCPSLKHLALEIQDCMLMGPLVQLEQLTSLEVHNSPTTPASFHQELLPVLNAIGDRLTVISLEQFDVVDLVTLAKLCRNLVKFSAQWFTILGHSNLNERTGRYTVKCPFPRLRYLRLRPRAQRMIPTPAVHFCLGQAEQLRHIELYCCHEFGDEDLKTLISSKDQNLNALPNNPTHHPLTNDNHPQFISNDNSHSPGLNRNLLRGNTYNQPTNHLKLAHLRCFILRHGHSLTKEGISAIISHAPQLQYIDCGRPPLRKGQNLDDD